MSAKKSLQKYFCDISAILFAATLWYITININAVLLIVKVLLLNITL